MNEQTPSHNPQSAPPDRHEIREQRRQARRELSYGSGSLSWVAGIILVLLGVVFLLQTMGKLTIPFHNWWALFILIPALGTFETALRLYRNAGNRLIASARGSLLGGLVLTLISASFLFNFDWAYFGPVLIILAGIGILLNFSLPGKE
jgi:hypothetical protein